MGCPIRVAFGYQFLLIPYYSIGTSFAGDNALSAQSHLRIHKFYYDPLYFPSNIFLTHPVLHHLREKACLIAGFFDRLGARQSADPQPVLC